jgi:hypothetical protein
MNNRSVVWNNSVSSLVAKIAQPLNKQFRGLAVMIFR